MQSVQGGAKLQWIIFSEGKHQQERNNCFMIVLPMVKHFLPPVAIFDSAFFLS